jgi:GMP synthase (glutamine-hydrolysing)
LIHEEKILIVDYGSQYTQLIARRIRELKVYSEIVSCLHDFGTYDFSGVKGIILSGGPASVLQKGAPRLDNRLINKGVPVLGVCYGLQLIALNLGGKIGGSRSREYGRAIMTSYKSDLFGNMPVKSQVWMSHGDHVEMLPPGFKRIGSTPSVKYAAVANEKMKYYGVQFHPEVAHTEAGMQILKNFVYIICNCEKTWSTESFIKSSVAEIKKTVGAKGRVICALSGGVDSSVVAVLLNKAIGKRAISVFIDNGLLRLNEADEVKAAFKKFGINLHFVDGTDLFLRRLKGISNPEEKRRKIGRAFIEIFRAEAKKIKGANFLAQGTLYPDLIESTSFKGPSATIKTHHNVGGLPKRMSLKLIEPLKELFKDEVRAVGRKLGLPKSFIGRHPFPGPGLAVRVLGSVTPERLRVLREADHIFISELRKWKLYDEVWQALAVLLPVRSVGVMGDERTYENVVALRAVTSLDAMTADWAHLPVDFLSHVSGRIINEVKGINRVVYDVSSKPPATIEWE